nr:hypothetical protein [Tanacetum cinerariifolium]
MLVEQQAVDDTANIVANDVDDVVAEDVAEPTPPSPPTTTPPLPQELPSTSHVVPTTPPSPIAPPPSPPQQQQPSQPTIISRDLLNNLIETCTALTRRVENLERDMIAQALEITKLKQRVRKLEKNKKLRIYGMKRLRKDVTLEEVKVEKNAEDDEQEPAKLQEVIEVVTTAKLMTKVVSTATTIVTAAAPITAATITTPHTFSRRRKGVVIRDPEETATPSTIIHSEPKSKEKGKGIMVEEPKPLKKQTQIKQDEAYKRELEAELN